MPNSGTATLERLTKPSITEGVNFIRFAWRELEFEVYVTSYNAKGSAELSLQIGDSEPYTTRVNLLNSKAMHDLVLKMSHATSKEIPWDEFINTVINKTLEIARRGEPVVALWPTEGDTLAPSYLLEPVIYLNHPTVLFGDYGSCKSLLALAVAYIVQLPYQNNTLGFITKTEPSTVLYLDYEDDPSSFRNRWSALEKGFGQGAMPILYRRMTGPLCDSVESVQKIINDKKIDLLIVDSLGPAARGNLNDPEPAINYHSALRQLAVTSLTLAHCAKDSFSKQKTIFGSVFFTNLARSVWEAKSEQETGTDEAIVSLKHTKANLSKKHLPLGFKINFADETIKISHADLADTSLSGELPLSFQIKDLLRHGPKSVREIAETFGAREDTTRTAINRLASKKDGLVKIGDKWGLKAL